MPRIRSVHPEICTSESMANISAELERTYVRLWTHCDDQGRCVDNPKLIKAAIYPLHDQVAAETLDFELFQLEQAGFLARYEVDGKRYIQIIEWANYQRPQKPRPSKYPEVPEAYVTPTVDVRDTDDTPTGLEWRGEGDGSRSTEVGEGTGDGDMSPTGTRNGAIVPVPKRRSLSKAELLADEHLAVVKAKISSGGGYDLLDEFRSVWSAAWTDAEERGVNPQQVAQRLAHSFFATVTGEPPDYGQVGRLVNRFGRAALLGLDAAIKNEADRSMSYAWTVCSRQVAEMKGAS